RLMRGLATDDSIRRTVEYDALDRWDYLNNADAVGATIFDAWLDKLLTAIWGDEFPRDEQLLYPSLDRTYRLINNEPGAKWFDNVLTIDTVETIDGIICQSFRQAIDTLRKRYGELSATDWAWGRVKNTHVMHLVPNFVSF